MASAVGREKVETDSVRWGPTPPFPFTLHLSTRAPGRRSKRRSPLKVKERESQERNFIANPPSKCVGANHELKILLSFFWFDLPQDCNLTTTKNIFYAFYVDLHQHHLKENMTRKHLWHV
jgi:hypothetical protein